MADKRAIAKEMWARIAMGETVLPREIRIAAESTGLSYDKVTQLQNMGDKLTNPNFILEEYIFRVSCGQSADEAYRHAVNNFPGAQERCDQYVKMRGQLKPYLHRGWAGVKAVLPILFPKKNR